MSYWLMEDDMALPHFLHYRLFLQDKYKTTVTDGFPAQPPAMQSIDGFLGFSLNKLLNKQSSCRWFDTP